MFYDSELYDSYGFVLVWMEMNMVVSKKKIFTIAINARSH